ncbi:hypothetical protein [Streptomyces sp. NPDC007088]|uniref:hypothetical protein n=1 Tax=Streptomyces sp. NPDC007088 TaxID=3364773 RepID=UPI00369A18A2
MTTTQLTKDGPPAVSRPSALDLIRSEIRLQRGALWVWLAFVTLTAALLLWLLGPGAHGTQRLFDTYGYSGVQGAAWGHGAGGQLLFGTYNDLIQLPATLLGLASLCVALYGAGPLTARELERGTVRLAWSQSVSPRRWLAAKLGAVSAFLVVGTALLVVLYRVLWSAHNNLMLSGIGPRALYFSVGPATVLVPLLALAVGVFCGLLLRRTLPAMLVAGLAQYLITGAVRGGRWPFTHTRLPPEVPVRGSAITSSGAHIPDPQCYDSLRCLARHDVVGFSRTYLPAPEFWPRQLTESGVLLAVTALAVAGAFWLLRRRAA